MATHGTDPTIGDLPSMPGTILITVIMVGMIHTLQTTAGRVLSVSTMETHGIMETMDGEAVTIIGTAHILTMAMVQASAMVLIGIGIITAIRIL